MLISASVEWWAHVQGTDWVPWRVVQRSSEPQRPEGPDQAKPWSEKQQISDLPMENWNFYGLEFNIQFTCNLLLKYCNR